MSTTFYITKADSTDTLGLTMKQTWCLCAQMCDMNVLDRVAAGTDTELDFRAVRVAAWPKCGSCMGTGLEEGLDDEGASLNLANSLRAAVLNAMGLDGIQGELGIETALNLVQAALLKPSYTEGIMAANIETGAMLGALGARLEQTIQTPVTSDRIRRDLSRLRDTIRAGMALGGEVMRWA